ncbi:MAG TPA: GDSL-type esterase/lipase family protein [Asticcacaulis sp.]|nr:GDSL-type esterase/lipase family protein [Asticcacaulis sp.]
MRHTIRFIAAACLLTAASASAQTPPKTPPQVMEPGVKYEDLPLRAVGRVTGDGRQQWPGVYFEGAFTGGGANIQLSDPVNAYNIYLDGDLVSHISPRPHLTTRVQSWTPGRHVVRIEKASESQGSDAPLPTAYVTQRPAPTGLGPVDNSLEDNHPLPPPPARPRQIEFIGDSYTVGYGNTSGKRQCTGDEIQATTDTSKAFGPLTAKHYNADYQINAYSGRGIVRNWDGGAGVPMPVLYPYALFDGKTLPAPTAWTPQVIVIGLGTNDFSTQLHTGEKWPTRDALHADYEATYVKFVQDLRTKNPKAFFILMASDQMDGEFQAEVKKVIASLQAQGESRIAFVGFSGLDYMACNWHPSTADDGLISQNIIAFIDAHPELWQGK